MPDFSLPFSVTIDLSFWQWFINLPLPSMAIVLYCLFGWILLVYFFLKGGTDLWVKYRQNTKWLPQWQWVLLAVDIPPLFIQTPKAVEQIFAHLSGAAVHSTVYEKFWLGKVQKWFSFEIISIEGYIQFLVRTEAQFRDLIEAAIYAQYTEAEIVEVEDYVTGIPTHYPDKDFDVFGVEFQLASEDAYPLRTYPSFEYNLSKDAVFSDPMAAILENFTRVGHGENLWMQLLIEPVGNGWKEHGIELVKKLMGQETHAHGGLGSMLTDIPQMLLKELWSIWHWNFEASEHDAGHESSADVTKLSPGTKSTIEAIEEKISKIGFKSKMRILYLARKEVYNPSRNIDGFVGSMSQFSMQDRNSLVPYLATHAHYDRHHRKSNMWKSTFTKAFQKRKMKWKKCDGYILNIEELATIWHFPLPFVKAPQVSKASAKRAEPPTGLPVESSEPPLRRAQPKIAPPPPAMDAIPEEELPENLPYA